MKGERKDPPRVERVMKTLRADFVEIFKFVDNYQARANALPEGEERAAMQKDIDYWLWSFNGQLKFKKDLMKKQGIKGDPKTYMYSEEQLADMYEKIKIVAMKYSDEDDIPSASK
jgi:hypothetical protein